MFGHNPFSPGGFNAVRQRVQELKREYPDLSNEELARVLISEKCWWCALAGCLTALPAVVPGLGTLIAILAGAAADITILGWAITRLVFELATLYGRDPTSLDAQREAFVAFGLAAGIHGLNQRLSRFAAAQFSKQLSTELLQKALLTLGVRASQRQLIPRVLPFAGVIIAGGINYFYARAIGFKMLRYYRDKACALSGNVIDVESGGTTG
ncbi:MAG TPA: hypothetical protein EYP63_02230 [Desulfotomaculum sp.]|nr:hypothetical protein [Desulfotomaculum sp.]